MIALRLMPRPLRRVKTEYLHSLLLIVLGVALFLPRLWSVVLIDHDDVISVIAATCNEGRYFESAPSGRWVAASEWQQYWQLDTFGCFEQISRGLVDYDIHPPLYFWLLHIWFSVFGVSIASGLILNLVVLLMATIIIYATCRLLSVSNVLSFIAALAWMLSLSSRMTIGVIRQYALLSMLTALMLLLMILWLKRGHIGYLIGLSMVLTAGFLTQYQFPVPAAFSLFFATAILVKRRDYRRVIQLVAAAAAAALIFLFTIPGFLESVRRARTQAQPFDLVGVPQRLASVGGTVLQIFNPLDWSHPLPYGLLDWSNPVYVAINVLNLIVGAAGVYLAARIAMRALKGRPHSIGALISIDVLPIFTAITSWATIVALYVFFVSPVHAIGLQYLHFVTPGLFIGLAQAAELSKTAIPRGLIAALPPILVVGAALATTVFVAHRSEQQQILEIRDAGALIVDSTMIGVLPTVLWQAAADTKVYAATQDELIAKFPDPTAVTDGPIDFVSSLAYGNTADKRELILQRLSELGLGKGAPLTASVVYLVPLGGDIYTFGH